MASPRHELGRGPVAGCLGQHLRLLPVQGVGVTPVAVEKQVYFDPVTPEEKSRLDIDALLQKCGWLLCNRDEIDIDAAPGVAVREFPLVDPFGEADYLLFLDGQAVGIIEAKPAGWTLKGVEIQSQRYQNGLPAYVDAVRRPLPFAYESTGLETQFTNLLEPQPRSRRLFAFHRPEELREILKLKEQSRARLEKMPLILVGDLWPKQVEAIQNLENSLKLNNSRALVQMATGSGKTFTAVNFVIVSCATAAPNGFCSWWIARIWANKLSPNSRISARPPIAFSPTNTACNCSKTALSRHPLR